MTENYLIALLIVAVTADRLTIRAFSHVASQRQADRNAQRAAQKASTQ